MIASHLLLGAVALFVLGGFVLAAVGAWHTFRGNDEAVAIVAGLLIAALGTRALHGLAKDDVPSCHLAPASVVERAP